MSLREEHDDFQFCLEKATERLGVPCRAIELVGPLERLLIERAVREFRVGMNGGYPWTALVPGRRGNRTVVGMDQYRLEIDGRVVRAVNVMNYLTGRPPGRLHDFWVVPVADCPRLYRYLRGELRRKKSAKQPEPVMRAEDRARLWDHTVGFLARGHELLARYNVPRKRGVLLLGSPGNGKTMACRWLAAELRCRGFEFRHVTASEYESAWGMGEARDLFNLDSAGLILFDDFDLACRRREDVGATPHHSTFLQELDGVETHEAVVYMFTSNCRTVELDDAFLRPGRIDQIIHFPQPDAALRRQLLESTWHTDILGGIDLDEAVADTEGLSFAEIEEVRKLLVLMYLDSHRWDWPRTLEAFRQTDRHQQPRSRIGFGFAHAALEQGDFAIRNGSESDL